MKTNIEERHGTSRALNGKHDDSSQGIPGTSISRTRSRASIFRNKKAEMVTMSTLEGLELAANAIATNRIRIHIAIAKKNTQPSLGVVVDESKF